MIKKIMRFLAMIDADQITFRKVGTGYGAHLNIQVEKLNDFNRNAYAMVTDALLNELMMNNTDESLLDEMTLDTLKINYELGLGNKSAFYEECCPNCGAVTGEYEVTTMGGTPDRNKRTCLRCGCTWFGYEVTAERVKNYIKGEEG